MTVSSDLLVPQLDSDVGKSFTPLLRDQTARCRSRVVAMSKHGRETMLTAEAHCR